MIKKYYKIEIIGKRDFIEKTIEALRLIRTKDSEEFKRVNKYLEIIKTGRKSRIILENSTFVVTQKVCATEVEWYASCIVHEVCHYYLHHIKGLKWKKGNMKAHEEYCIEYQAKFLEGIKAPKRLVDWCRKTLEFKHWYKRKKQRY